VRELAKHEPAELPEKAKHRMEVIEYDMNLLEK
jgi:hypothetical protein